MNRHRRCCRTGDQGSATLWLLGVAMAVVILTGAVMMAGGFVVARHRAATAADLGALAGARQAFQGEAVACAEAERIVRANGATLVICRVEALDVVITVSVPGPSRWGAANASARAGPERA